MTRSGSRFAVFICNILVVLLCAAANLPYFFSPLWQIKIEYLLRAETLEKMLGDEAEGVDLDPVVGEGIKLSLDLETGTSEILKSLIDSDAEKTVERTIESNADKIVDQLTPVLKDISEKVLRSVTEKKITETVKDQVKDFLSEDGDQTTDERVQEILDKAGFTDEYISSKTDELIDAIYADDATLDSVSKKTEETVEEVFSKLANSGETAFENAELTEEDKEKIKETVSEYLSVIADENGNINADEIAASLLLELLRATKNQEETSPETDSSTPSETIPETNAPAFALLASEVPNDSNIDVGNGTNEDDAKVESKEEELKREIKQYIMDYISEDTENTIVLTLKITAGIVLFSMFTWVYLVLKILLKLFSKNPAIKLKLPIWLGWLPFLILTILPRGIIALFKTSPAFLTDRFGAEIVTKANNFLASASLSFSSSGKAALIAAIALIVLSIPYGLFRRRLKNGDDYDYYDDDEDED